MRRHPPLFLPLLAALLLAGPLSAVPLEIAEVWAPAINCVCDGDCRITVNDSTAVVTLPAATGEGFLQSRTAPSGEAGTTGEGFVPYEYRLDLRPIGGVTALPCFTELSLDFGDHRPLDYDGDGDPEDVFVVTGGGLRSVGLASADRTGDRITFRFAPAVCAGNRPGAGESNFFFGLAGSAPPRPVTAQATLSLGGTLDLAAGAPGAEGGGAAPPIAESCFPGLPIRADVPVCRCLRDATLRELRCGVFHPDFYLVRRTPLPIPPGQPFEVNWTLVPRERLLWHRGGGGKARARLPDLPGLATYKTPDGGRKPEERYRRVPAPDLPRRGDLERAQPGDRTTWARREDRVLPTSPADRP